MRWQTVWIMPSLPGAGLVQAASCFERYIPGYVADRIGRFNKYELARDQVTIAKKSAKPAFR